MASAKPTKYRAYLCCGANCGPKGSGALLDFLVEEVERLGIDGRVSVLPTGCQSHCESGPTMVVYPGPVYYMGIDRQRLIEIAVNHLRDGLPVEEYFWKGKPLRIRPGPAGRLAPNYKDGPSSSLPKARTQGEKPKRTRPQEDVDDLKW